MELFHKAKAVLLRSNHDKYLTAEEDEESVTQARNGASRNTRWTVEFLETNDYIIRLKSCYGKYLMASDMSFLLGMTGHKVIQTAGFEDSSVEWEPIREGNQVKLRTRQGNFLRANGGIPPWRNSVTHDVPNITATQDWILWDVDAVEIQLLQSPQPKPSAPSESQSSSESNQPFKSPNFGRQDQVSFLLLGCVMNWIDF
ncbi:hypothetical protein RHMOL_Rhmol12G0061900 [Rhododendron molle]|uniref:Uncharacterized protein n=1 Tax=Rhododendron molle TaxID=49168 RepID=A0ACC0LEV2_RHOML|nr:hypothetical protein RHMOL_Rhmol12G0061900 [Rhododendron molle]